MADVVAVTDPTDARLADFVALNDPATRRRVERAGDYFVVEGTLAIERLLALPRWEVRSLLLLPRVADRLAELLAGRDVEVAVADEEVLRAVVGFDLHRGALASVRRQAPTPAAHLVAGATGPGASGGLLLAVEGVNDHENLGALYRNATAFGVEAVLLEPTCADPFYRRAVRVSLGHVLAVPTGRLDPLPEGLDALHRVGATTIALTPGAPIELRDLDSRSFGDGPVVVVVGAEGPGLTGATLDASTHRVSIPMANGVDSLNVATAAALALHHLRG
jgi:tRNA G18 (ribose-2'-O)-methylase SpoU